MFGSSVAIGVDQNGRSIFLTMGHIFRGTTDFRGTTKGVWVGFKQQWHEATVLKAEIAEGCDLAVLAVEGNHDLLTYPVYDGDPSEGIEVAMYGFRRNQYTEEIGTARNLRGTITWFNGKTHQGMSGGAIVISVNGMAKTIAIIGGVDMRNARLTWGTGLPKIREFIADLGLQIEGFDEPAPPKVRPKKKKKTLTPTMEIDYNRLAAIIMEQMKGNESFRGPEGKRGPIGKAGSAGDIDIALLEEKIKNHTRQMRLDIVRNRTQLNNLKIPIKIVDENGNQLDFDEYEIDEETKNFVTIVLKGVIKRKK